MLSDILKDTGIKSAELDKYGILYASLPENTYKNLSIGLIAHIDTSDAVPNNDVKPLVHHYKCGIAEIIEALYVFKEHPELKHPEIKIAFTPDEEIGCGAENYHSLNEFVSLETMQKCCENIINIMSV